MSVEQDAEFLQDWAVLGSFGATPAGGVHREAATAADGEQRAWFSRWLTDRGFRVEFDRVGNQFGLLEPVPGAPYVLVGSHLDSQPFGGRYDGAYGVLAGAHAALRLSWEWAAGGSPLHNVAVVNWFNEEGSRFTPSMFGSGVFTGKLDLATALDTTDLRGVTVREALTAIDGLGTGTGPDVACYAEIHIEQGRILDTEGIQIGLVEGTWAAQKYTLTVLGDQSHTGSTIMADRQDALLGAAHLVVAARELADQLGTDEAPLHTSVSRMVVEPNSPVVIAREVRMNLDMRSPDEALLARADELLHARFAEIEATARVRIEKAASHAWDRQAYPPDGVKLARSSAEQLGLSHRDIMTVAGHDSTNMKDVVPTVMLFVPSVEGISHNEREFTTDADLCAGLDLLTDVLRRLADGELVTT